MIVVSDTTILSTLYLINRLDWLEDLFRSRKMIPLVKPVLDEIRSTGGFWMSERLYEYVLEVAEEIDNK